MATEIDTPETGDTEPVPETGTTDDKPTRTEPVKAPSRPTRTTPTTRPAPEPEPDPETLEDAMEAVERLRKRVANLTDEKERHRRKVAELSESVEQRQKAEEAKLSEVERLGKRLNVVEREKTESQARIADLEAGLLAARKSFRVQLEAYRQEFEHPEDVPGLIRLDAIEVDDDGEPLKASVEKAVKKLAESRPGYVRPQRGGTPARDAAGRPLRNPLPGRPGRNDPYEHELAVLGKAGRM